MNHLSLQTKAACLQPG